MSDISYTRTGIIKKVGEEAIIIEMTDTGESLVWPLPSNDDETDIRETLEAGEEITIEMHISDDPFAAGETKEEEASRKEEIERTKEDEAEAERMRKMLEELLN